MSTTPSTYSPIPNPQVHAGAALPEVPTVASTNPDSTTPDLREMLRRVEIASPVETPAPTSEQPPPRARRGATPGPPRDSMSQPPTAAVEVVNSTLDKRSRKLSQRRIMIVDDEETNILTVQTFLEQNGYQNFLSTTDSRNALPMVRSEKPDVVLLDINMPHINGLEILKCLASDPVSCHLPVLVLTAATDPKIKQQALEFGASDFLSKPVDPHDLIPRVRNALLMKMHIDEIAGENAKLDELVRKRTEDLSTSRQQLIMSLAKAAEHRDTETGNHVLRVGRYAGIVARALGWSQPRVQMLELAAQLHDVGKIGVPDAILFKPGKLDPQEWELMRKHCAFGKDIIEPVSDQDLSRLRSHTRLGADMLHVRSSPMMIMAARIAQTHHEKWDGTGYPIGLAGEDIPIEGRITAIADVFDALSSERSYKSALPREKCFEIIAEGKGSHFDPQVVEAFFRQSAEIVQVQIDLMDRQAR